MNDNGLSFESVDKPKSKPKRPSGGGNNLGRVVRLGLLALAGLCGMSMLCVGGFVYVIYRSTQPVADVGNTFLQAIADEDYEAAFSTFSDGLQSEYGSAEELGATLREQNIDPQRWSFSSRSVDTETGELGSTVVMANGAARDVTIRLRWSGTLWLIEFFSFD